MPTHLGKHGITSLVVENCVATVGVGVFRCADFGWRTFYFVSFQGGKENEKTSLKTISSDNAFGKHKCIGFMQFF